MTADLSVELNEATLYADDGAAEVVKEFKAGTLSLGIDDIGAPVASDLTGSTIDANGVVISASEDGGDPVAVGFRAKKSNGKYRYYWLYRVKFGIPATNLATKGDSITFSTPTIEGTIMRRNKLDAFGKHPWKAEVTEGTDGVDQSVIDGWYDEVYEPSGDLNLSPIHLPAGNTTT
jgi:phi13 family phage major tail protein